MHRFLNKKFFAATIALVCMAPLVMGNSSCGGGNETASQQRSTAVQQRADAYQRAQDLYPSPNTQNFPLRKALVEFTQRQDETNHPWYVYILGMNGNTVGYYVAKTVPINACDFLSSTQDITSPNGDGNVVVSAPSLDGIYYGGSGSSSGCDAWFFFDAATNALVQIRGVGFFSSDQPLKVDAQPIRVAQ